MKSLIQDRLHQEIMKYIYGPDLSQGSHPEEKSLKTLEDYDNQSNDLINYNVVYRAALGLAKYPNYIHHSSVNCTPLQIHSVANATLFKVKTF